MRNRKQLLADFYLELLAINDNTFYSRHIELYDAVLMALSLELNEKPSVILGIFERMAVEDNR